VACTNTREKCEKDKRLNTVNIPLGGNFTSIWSYLLTGDSGCVNSAQKWIWRPHLTWDVVLSAHLRTSIYFCQMKDQTIFTLLPAQGFFPHAE
jgi:hypothetical protein